MNLELFLAFVLATIVMIIIPGPSVLLTVAHAMAFGTRRALVTLAGIVSGISVQLAATLIGMTSFMLFLAEWFELLRWAGVAYLVYLGLQQWLSKPEAAGPAASAGRSGRSLFAQGFLVTVTNPKSMVFLAAFFPQFVDPAAPPGPAARGHEPCLRGHCLCLHRALVSAGRPAGQLAERRAAPHLA